jgi:hypothetical protein
MEIEFIVLLRFPWRKLIMEIDTASFLMINWSDIIFNSNRQFLHLF